MFQSEEQESQYVIGEIVWAKVKGHPWWPGMVSSFFYYRNQMNLIFFKCMCKKHTNSHCQTVLTSYLNTRWPSLVKKISNHFFLIRNKNSI